jgi:DhnA family fructose-bisphosphate aldolase class Ia
MTAQTPAERQRSYAERRTAQGLKLMRNLWAHPDDHQVVKALVEKLTRKREKEQR